MDLAIFKWYLSHFYTLVPYHNPVKLSNLIKLPQIGPRVPAHLCHFLPRALAVRRCPTSSAVEQGFLLMEDMSGKGVPANFYEGLTAGQVNLIWHQSWAINGMDTIAWTSLIYFPVRIFGV